MAAEVAVSEKKPGSLDTLSKEELVQKCKSLLQLAHKAKNAKDDKQKQYDAIQAESEKEKEELQNRISLLESKNEDIEDLLKSKQRKIDRLSDENDSFLGQVDTLCSQINNLKKERAEGETDLQKVQGELNKL